MRLPDMKKLVISLLLATAVLSAQTGLLRQEPAPRAKAIWRVSVASLAVANLMDVHSSWGKHELNPALAAGPSATFGAQGALIKLGLQGALLGIEYLVTKGHPTRTLYKALSIVNFGA